jgi:hypothetical protein
MAGCCEHGDEPSSSGAKEVVILQRPAEPDESTPHLPTQFTYQSAAIRTYDVLAILAGLIQRNLFEAETHYNIQN